MSYTISTMLDLSASHESFFSSNSMTTRKRFFSSPAGEASQELPLTCSSLPESPSSDNSRLAPGRSASSSAALLRQRITGSPVNDTKRTHSYSGISNDIDSFFIHKPSSQQSTGQCQPSFYATCCQGLFLVAFMGLCIFARMSYEHTLQLQHSLFVRDHEIEHHLHHVQNLEGRIQQLRTQSVRLNQHVEELQLRSATGETALQRQLFHMEHNQAVMRQGIQFAAVRMVQEKFGPGPCYLIEVQLQLPNEDHPSTILLQTAHISDMPHSIHLFLEQVSHGLYDGTVFHCNANHILQAGPHNIEKAHAKFRDYPSLNSVLFQEYSHHFPHAQYTVGYPGRPGGPDFYINVQDNTELHGPGGQEGHYRDAELADPCFAKVVAGYDVIERLQKSPVDWEDVLVDPVVIQHMRVLTEEESHDWMNNDAVEDEEAVEATE